MTPPPASIDAQQATVPAGYRALRDRSRPGALERLVEAERDGQRVALRLSPGAVAAEMRSELAVLAAVEHPALARLVDYGALDGGGSFVAREWIDGRELAAWAKGRSSEELGRVVARLCAGLHALHERGFVHGDLKASNVIVVEDAAGARPVLTDFGLARARGTGGAVGGTLFHIAPELLLGGSIDAAADLFALGVMLHELLIARRPSAREFYGRFPASDFFAATDTRAEELPEWARDVVAALLERDKLARPATAADVGRTLAGRLGLGDLFREPVVTLRWPATRARAEWLERCSLESFAGDGGQARFTWIFFAMEEDPRPVIDELALRAALAGRRVQRIDAVARSGELRNVADLDRFARELCAANVGTTLCVALERHDAWAVRAVETLAQVIAQSAVEARPAGLLVGARSSAPGSELGWNVLEAPEVGDASIAAFVHEQLALEGTRALNFTRVLAAAARGSATRLDRALQRAVRDGWVVAGDVGARLRPGPLPTRLDESTEGVALPRERGAAQLLAAVFALGGRASLADAAALAELAGSALAHGVGELTGAGLACLEPGGLRALVAAPQRAQDLVSEDEWRALHARLADELARGGAPRHVQLPHLLRAERANIDGVVVECELLRDRGCGELALALSDAAIEQRRAAQREPEPELFGERALAWCAMGDADRALEVLGAWSDESRLDAHTAAIAQRIRGQVATLRHELTAALQHFERARALDPDDGGLSALGKARLLFEMGRDREVLALVEELRQSGAQRILPRAWANVLAAEAMSLFRVGEVARAKLLLETYLEDARAANDAGREAGLRINLATVERRAGELPRALQHFERAVELYEGAGLLPGLAQARAQFGSTLREVGELSRAQPLLASSLSIRERLGDRVGATNVRGMLGLLLADRGHARPATEELERAARDLRADERRRVAALLEARALELRARCGDRARLNAGVASEVERAAEGDPRILLSRARALWLAGESKSALEYMQRADALAGSLGLVALRQEAQFLGARVRSEAPRPPSATQGESLVDDDERVCALLAHAPLDVGAARALASELARRGRDDRAARVLLAVAARVEDELAARDAGRAEELIALCTRGLSQNEALAFRGALLSLPDPWPEDLVAHERRRAEPEENEMEVIGLLEINHRLLAQEDLRSLLGTIVEQALAVSGAQRGFLILEEEGELKVDTALDSRRGDIDKPDVEVSGSVLRDALAKMRPVRVSNAVDDPLLGAAPSVISLELRSILCVPFEVQRGLRGVIYVDHRLREGAFDARAERMLALLSDQAALAILQVRRLEEIRRLNRELGRQVARQESDLRTATEALRKANLPAPAGGLVGDSAPMREVRRLIERAAQSKLSVLVAGPSGSGKELAARALHELGPRREGPFISENCAALPASLIEGELFGARRGAYTGADRDREGLFERASGGTLFLDEIGELPLELQAKLLRVLETSQVRRLGDDKVRQVDFRLVAATNRDLGREVADSRFRADLFYRLDGLRITLPALAVRAEDIPALVDHYLRFQAEPGRAPRKISAEVVTRLCRRAWPGNVRELFNELARLLVMSAGDIDDFALLRDPEPGLPTPAVAGAGGVKPLEQLEREAILHALEISGNDKRKAAALLGISRAKVYQRLKDWGLSGGDAPEE